MVGLTVGRGCIFMSWDSAMAKSRCSMASARSSRYGYGRRLMLDTLNI